MNARSEALYHTPGFSPSLSRQLSTSSASQYTDAFARRERQTAAQSTAELGRTNIFLQIGEQTVVLTYPSQANLPPWAAPVLTSVSERWGIAQGWDSYEAKPTKLDHVVGLLNCLSAIMKDDSKAPLITPLADGGVQAEWHNNNLDLEVVVSADDPPTYYYYNAATQDEEGEALTSRYARVRELIGHF